MKWLLVRRFAEKIKAPDPHGRGPGRSTLGAPRSGLRLGRAEEPLLAALPAAPRQKAMADAQRQPAHSPDAERQHAQAQMEQMIDRRLFKRPLLVARAAMAP